MDDDPVLAFFVVEVDEVCDLAFGLDARANVTDVALKPGAQRARRDLYACFYFGDLVILVVSRFK
ncbi:hypothetical protein D3C87_2053880 [compost metagenome]